ncbi:MFS transporter [Methylovirgula sp. 4M-Z18]|uniref:MFS transporter n=1 Tax=Methylovirgula sp. 4M-Z18 TaxID=2293567 RepID=UPI000E2FBDD6|nr:MFS transporter [Methylovirgula sp. 4M-Z18]RFB79916.1 MFS transporter [Methylovirgula sp. 4M-Z18]
MTPSTPVTLHEDVHQKRSHRHTVTPGEIAIGVIIGRTSEYFDFFVYAIASVLVFPKLIFTNLDALHGTIYSFAIFALAFIARPFGSIIFTAIDRQFGRTSKLTIALFMLGGSTAAIAFLPGYEQIGNWSAILLSILRVGQGLALGGSWDGLPSLLNLSAPVEKRGSYAMIPQLGAPLGLIVASGLFAYFLGSLGLSDFLDWGWRYPFFVAFAINVVALFSRLRIVATPEYEELFASQELQPSPIGETIRQQGFTIWLGAFAPLASFALFHMVTLFPLSWVFIFTKQEPVRFLVIEMITALLGVIAIIASGPIANRIGRRMLLVVSAIAIGFYSGYAPQFLDRGEIGQIVYMAVGFVLLGISFGQSSGAVASAFPINYRYTGSALTADLAWMFGAGFAPVVALVLTDKLGLPAAGGYLLSGALWTLLALWVQKTLEDRAQ